MNGWLNFVWITWKFISASWSQANERGSEAISFLHSSVWLVHSDRFNLIKNAIKSLAFLNLIPSKSNVHYIRTVRCRINVWLWHGFSSSDKYEQRHWCLVVIYLETGKHIGAHWQLRGIHWKYFHLFGMWKN